MPKSLIAPVDLFQGTKSYIFVKRVGGDADFKIIHAGSRFISDRDTIHSRNCAKLGQEIKTKINSREMNLEKIRST